MSQTRTPTEPTAHFLVQLKEKIREQGFTDLDVEEALDWDPGQFELLNAGTKGLLVDEVMSILGAIGVEPKTFFAELYDLSPGSEWPHNEIAEVSSLADSLADVLVKNQVLTASELTRAVAARVGKPLLPKNL